MRRGRVTSLSSTKKTLSWLWWISDHIKKILIWLIYNQAMIISLGGNFLKVDFQVCIPQWRPAVCTNMLRVQLCLKHYAYEEEVAPLWNRHTSFYFDSCVPISMEFTSICFCLGHVLSLTFLISVFYSCNLLGFLNIFGQTYLFRKL